MAEVGIHFEYIFIVAVQRPFESGYVGRTQSQLSLTLHHKQAVGKLPLQVFYDSGSTVGRTVFDNKYMESVLQGKNSTDDILDIFPFVVGGDDDNTV